MSDEVGLNFFIDHYYEFKPETKGLPFKSIFKAIRY